MHQTSTVKSKILKIAGNKLHLLKSFSFVVLVPFLLISLYYGAIASKRYVSEAKLTIRQNGASQETGSIVNMLRGGGSSREDNQHLREYVLSLDMLEYLEKAVGLRQAYQQQGDYLSRLWPWASQEEVLNYYRKRVQLVYDDTIGILTLRTQGFDPVFARRLNAAILHQCEKFINDTSHHIAEEQLRFISGELSRAGEDLQNARQKLLLFQNRHNLLDPVEKAKALSAFVQQIETDLGRQQAELKNLLSFLSDEAPQVIALRSRILAQNQQLQEEKLKLSGGNANKLNAVSNQFQLLQFQVEFAQDKYKAALSAYEKTRIDTSRKVKNLVIVSSPHVQEEAEYPRRLYIIITSLIALSALYGLFRLLIATIEDHRE